MVSIIVHKTVNPIKLINPVKRDSEKEKNFWSRDISQKYNG